MNSETKTYVIELLNGYHKRARQIALLRYELAHPATVTDEEMISGMHSSHQAGPGHVAGHISNKTLYIALNYREQAEMLNAKTVREISGELRELEQEQARLEYYISLLEPRQALVLRKTCFEKIPQEKVAEELDVSVRRVQDIKAQAIESLAEMYDFTSKLH